MDDREAVYVISVAAKLADMHPQTLRVYERKGFIAPERTQGRSRRYSERDVVLLRHIHQLSAGGVGLEGIRQILELEKQLSDAQRAIADLEQEADEMLTRMRQQVEDVKRSYKRELMPLPKAAVVRAAS